MRVVIGLTLRRGGAMLRLRSIGCLSLMLLCSAPALANDADRWVLFSNTRFGSIAEIPQGLFKAQQPPANGDGRTFRSSDGAEIRIYGNLGEAKD